MEKADKKPADNKKIDNDEAIMEALELINKQLEETRKEFNKSLDAMKAVIKKK